MGYLFQEYALFPHLDVLANVRFGAGRGAARRRNLLDRFRIAHLARARIRELSGGERQRVALARALALEPGCPAPRRAPVGTRHPHQGNGPGSSCTNCSATLPFRRSSSRMTSRTRPRLPTDIGVIVDGRILQSGTATELVANPSDPFVASFTGATLLEGTASAEADGPHRGGPRLGGNRLEHGLRAQVASALPSTRGKRRSRATSRPSPPSTTSAPPSPRSCRSGTAPASESARSWPRSQQHRQTRMALREGDVVVASFESDDDLHPLDVTCEPRTLHADLTTLVSGRSSTGRLRRSGRHVRRTAPPRSGGDRRELSSPTSAAATFSARRCSLVVPGIGTSHGFCVRIQASATWAVSHPGGRRSRQGGRRRRDSPPEPPGCSGEHGSGSRSCRTSCSR